MSKLKRLSAPEFWKIPKKIYKWTVSPRAGPHKKDESIPLQILARDILKLVETGKEAKTIIKRGEILVDGKKRKDHAYPAGLMDAIQIPKIKKSFRIIPTEKGLSVIEIPENESKLKLFRINNKKIVKKGKLQLNLHDGKNILVGKNSYKTGDSILLELPSLKIVEHIEMKNGNLALILKGKNAGKIAKIKEAQKQRKVICELDNKAVEIIKDYVFVVGKNKPVISLSE